MGNTYIVYNGAMPTTSSAAKVTTGTSVKTMLQVKPAVNIEVVEWGVSFDGSAAATPGICELIDTSTVYATVTAYAVADVMPHNNPDAPANTSGTSGTPLNLGTSASGYTSTAEGSITATRLGDVQLVAPTNQNWKQFPLDIGFGVLAGDSLRIRVNFGTAVNCLCYVIFKAL
jgi:hypothetical protein